MEQLKRRLFEQSFAELDKRYDESEKMLKVPFESSGYHTTLKGGMVHPNRDSMVYGLALLDSGKDEYIARAEDVINTVISHQDADPNHDTYGIWSYHLEESLAEMSPPDWNWADFIGKELLAVVLRHGSRISAQTKERVDAAVRTAAESIRRRNMGPHYTNIAIMGTYVTHVYAELYNDRDMLAYSKQRLATFVDYTKENGAFTEYNSPTYNLLATTDLARMVAHLQDAESKELAAWLHDFAWKNIALHFHPATQQWAGPHSRAYANLQSPEFHTILYLATNGAVEIIDTPLMSMRTGLYKVPLQCPEKYWRLIMDPAERQLREGFVKSDPDYVATTFLASSSTLGSFYKSSFWNQSRPVIAYWDNEEDPTCLTVQFLHNGYDFSSGMSINVQNRNRLLGALCLATDAGDTHPHLDPIRDSSIDAEDLRLRFKVTGKRDNVDVSLDGDTVVISDGARKVGIRLLYTGFEGQALAIETGHDGDGDWADVILYHGREKHFRLPHLSECVIGFALDLDLGDVAALKSSTSAVREDSVLHTSYQSDDGRLDLTVPVIPAPRARVYAESSARVGGISVPELR